MGVMMERTVLITGAGAPGAPGIIKSLRNGDKDIKIIGVDAALSESIGIGMVDKSYKIPLANHPDFVNEVLKIAVSESVDVIIPLVTRELSVFAKAKDIFAEKGIKIIVSDHAQLDIANNKYKLMQFCKSNDIPVPDFYLVKSIDEFKQKAYKLGYPEKKICFKPPVSNGLRGFRIIDDSQNKMESLLNEKPNNVFIGFEEFIQIAKDSDFFPELLLMEYLPGEEYSVDVLAHQGKYIQAIPRSRDKIKMGISFVGRAIEDDQILNYSKQLIEKLGLHGNIGIQFRRDTNGIPKIIESNPRVQGTIVLCTAAGFNMVHNAVKLNMGEKLPECNIKWGTKMIRYWEESFFDKDDNLICDETEHE
jgi:carbamoyl-phosphate synthase large subunit